jgi:glycosyltransferase involved in cell wall biosynthesis
MRSFQQKFVTVILPIRNEEDFIARCLAAVLQQDYSADRMEVLIADGMSTDATREQIVLIARQNVNASVRIVNNPHKIVATGFNLALAEAKGDVIVRVDGHTLIERDYIRQCVDALERSGADNVGGRMKPVGHTLLGQAVALATSSPFGVGGGRFHYSDQEEWVDTVYMGAWRRDAFDRFGMFDEEFVRNQDDEFNYRTVSMQGKILLSPKIRSLYFNRSTLGSLWRQYYEYGFYKVRVMQKHPRQMRLGQFAPLALIVGLMFGFVVGLLVDSVFNIFLALLASYVGATLLASISLARELRWRQILLLPIVFAVLHFGYGFGFMVGLIKFRDRWR